MFPDIRQTTGPAQDVTMAKFFIVLTGLDGNEMAFVNVDSVEIMTWNSPYTDKPDDKSTLIGLRSGKTARVTETPEQILSLLNAGAVRVG